MASCEQHQEQLLDYLYDLLDAAERQALQDHLGQCSACQAALARAQAQQKLLARAAKAKFPSVRFQPPAETVPAQTRPLRLDRFPQRRRWAGWAYAAAILVALGSVAVMGGRYVLERAAQQETIAQADSRRPQALE